MSADTTYRPRWLNRTVLGIALASLFSRKRVVKIVSITGNSVQAPSVPMAAPETNITTDLGSAR